MNPGPPVPNRPKRIERPLPPSKTKTSEENPDAPRAVPAGTQAALVGVALTAFFLQGDTPSQIGHFAAIGAGISILISVAADARLGLFNLARADLMAILSFYFLTLFEFLFPQPLFDTMNKVASTHTAALIVLLGLSGLLIGRHLFHPKKQPLQATLTREMPTSLMIAIYWGSVVVGFAYMFAAVDFNPVRVLDNFMSPRFSQDWSRGRFGDWRALLYELNMFLYLVAPLAGVILGRRKRYGFFQIIGVILAVLFLFFYAFTSGTRNLFACYLVTFVMGYTFSLPKDRKGEIIPICIASALAMVAATTIMLRFREVGFKEWLKYGKPPAASDDRTLFVDYNLWAIARLVEVFPEKHDYLGWEVPYLALIRPIPRAIWPGKPEGMSFTIEDALGEDQMTVAASFAGEAYMAGGFIAVFLIGLSFGIAAGWWNSLYSPKNSEMGLLIYASGFFSAVISMRSLFVFTTALMPTAAGLVIAIYFVRYLSARAAALVKNIRGGKRPPPRPAPFHGRPQR
jgi:hypothetical protein